MPSRKNTEVGLYTVCEQINKGLKEFPTRC